MSDDHMIHSRAADEEHEHAREMEGHDGQVKDPTEMWDARRDLVVAEQDVIIADLLNRVEALEASMRVLLAGQEQDVEQQIMIDSEPDA
jgi:hypothetical protein